MGLVLQLLQVDMLIYSPIALINFKFIPVGLSQTVFVNATDLAVIELRGLKKLSKLEFGLIFSL